MPIVFCIGFITGNRKWLWRVVEMIKLPLNEQVQIETKKGNPSCTKFFLRSLITDRLTRHCSCADPMQLNQQLIIVAGGEIIAQAFPKHDGRNDY